MPTQALALIIGESLHLVPRMMIASEIHGTVLIVPFFKWDCESGIPFSHLVVGVGGASGEVLRQSAAAAMGRA